MSITASMVSELRSKTGAGMMDCKKALVEAGGEMEKAVEILRKKGLSAAAKKAGRAAAEGMVVAAGEGQVGVLVEVNAETDFVAKNDSFIAFADGVAEAVLKNDPADVDALKSVPFPGAERTVEEELTHQISTIGENMNIRRFVRFAADNGAVASYVHGAGKIGVLVEFTGAQGDERLAELGRQVAMHVAAANPQFLDRSEVPAEVVEKEKEIMRAKAKESGKPDHIIEKIIEGQLNKFFGEVCLREQAFVIDPDQSVGKAVAALGKELGSELVLSRYARFQLGEGVEKKEDDFAAEVAKMSQ